MAPFGLFSRRSRDGPFHVPVDSSRFYHYYPCYPTAINRCMPQSMSTSSVSKHNLRNHSVALRKKQTLPDIKPELKPGIIGLRNIFSRHTRQMLRQRAKEHERLLSQLCVDAIFSLLLLLSFARRSSPRHCRHGHRHESLYMFTDDVVMLSRHKVCTYGGNGQGEHSFSSFFRL